MRNQKQHIMDVLEAHVEERVKMPELVKEWKKFIANHTARVSEIRKDLAALKMEIVCWSKRKNGERHTFYMLKPSKSKAQLKPLPM
jgi:hypothetical protein